MSMKQEPGRYSTDEASSASRSRSSTDQASSASRSRSSTDQDVINLESEDEEPMRDDYDDDYDELADLAVTACEEPPPPGTRPLQEELLTLITENTVSGITINKDEVVAWLRNEDALLTGEETLDFPSPPNSEDKYSVIDESRESDQNRSNSGSPERKLSSVAVRTSNGSRDRQSSRDRDRTRDVSPRDRWNRDKRFGGRPNNSRSRLAEHSPYLRRSTARARRNSRSPPSRRTTRSPPSRHDSRVRSPVTRRTSPGRMRRNPHARLSPDRLLNSRKVKVQHRVEDGKRSPTYHQVPVGRGGKMIRGGRKGRRGQAEQRRGAQGARDTRPAPGVRDARDLLTSKRDAVPMTDYVVALKNQIRSSEMNAHLLFKELSEAKKDLLTYLQTTEVRDERSPRRDGNRSPRRKEGSCSPRREGDRRRRAEGRMKKSIQDERDSRIRQREEEAAERQLKMREERADRVRERRDESARDVSRKTDDSTRRRDDRKRTRKEESSEKRSGRSRRSATPSDKGSSDPREWQLIPPSKVAGFNCRGPAIFVQKFSKGVSRKDIFSYFKIFGTVMDVQKLDLGKERVKSACVIFSRQSEADRALQIRTDRHGDVTPPDMLTPPNKFDALLSALQKGKAGTSDQVVIVE